MTNHEDVVAFFEKFDLPRPAVPTELSQDLFDFRWRFMQEELRELIEARAEGDLAGQADALVDLVYVVLGTAVMMGLPWQALWDAVQAANLRKVRASHAGESRRGTALDVVKPPGWTAPDLRPLLGLVEKK